MCVCFHLRFGSSEVRKLFSSAGTSRLSNFCFCLLLLLTFVFVCSLLFAMMTNQPVVRIREMCFPPVRTCTRVSCSHVCVCVWEREKKEIGRVFYKFCNYYYHFFLSEIEFSSCSNHEVRHVRSFLCLPLVTCLLSCYIRVEVCLMNTNSGKMVITVCEALLPTWWHCTWVVLS